jgi:hypothetical protein
VAGAAADPDRVGRVGHVFGCAAGDRLGGDGDEPASRRVLGDARDQARPAAQAATPPVPDTSAARGTQAYDVLKQACPGSGLEVPDSTYAKNGGSYSWLGTGYDDWPGGDCLVGGTYVAGYSYADFQFAVPTKIDGSVI